MSLSGVGKCSLNHQVYVACCSPIDDKDPNLVQREARPLRDSITGVNDIHPARNPFVVTISWHASRSLPWLRLLWCMRFIRLNPTVASSSLQGSTFLCGGPQVCPASAMETNRDLWFCSPSRLSMMLPRNMRPIRMKSNVVSSLHHCQTYLRCTAPLSGMPLCRFFKTKAYSPKLELPVRCRRVSDEEPVVPFAKEPEMVWTSVSPV